MTINIEAFVDLQEKFKKVNKLIHDESKNDPDNDPFRSKNQARQILIAMRASIEKLLRKQPDGVDPIKLTAMHGTIYLYLGTLGLDVDEPFATIEKHLERCREIIEKIEDDPKAVLVALNMYNQFGLLWSVKDPAKAKYYIDKAQALYKTFKETQQIPIILQDMFEANLQNQDVDKALKNMENVYTVSYYYLAQISGRMGEDFLSAVYCHITLQKQLDMDLYEPIDWSLNSATLSQFFMEKDGFKQARHHLAASVYILNKYKTEKLDTEVNKNEEYESKLETFNHRSADVARCWIKYGIFLLTKSKERLLAHTENIDEKCTLTTDLSHMKLSDNSNITVDDLMFNGIDVSQIESEITDKFILILPEARKVFQRISSYIKAAQEYYSLQSLASDYIEIVQDHSQLYLSLLFFEDNQDNQAKLHKRRIDLLENIIANVNSQYYTNYCRQIWFELGQCYSDIVYIKAEKIRDSKKVQPQALTKHNNLIDKSIKNFKTFLSAFTVNVESREKIRDNVEKSYLQAVFYVAALYGRYMIMDQSLKLKNIEKQLEYYKYITEYCAKNPKAEELIQMELGICKEMVLLLPAKILKLSQAT